MVNILSAASILAFFFVYSAVIALSRHLVVGRDFGPPLFWPAMGLLFATLFVTKPRRWWIYALTGLAASIFGNWVSGVPNEAFRFLVWPFRMLIMFGGVYTLLRLSRDYPEDSPQWAVLFVLIGGIVTPGLSATVSTLWMQLKNPVPFMEVFRVHFVGSSLGILTVTPFLLAIFQMYRESRLKIDWKPFLTNLGIFLFVFVACLHIFVFDFLPRTVHFELLVMPLIIAISFRGSQTLTATANLMISAFAFYRVVNEKSFFFSFGTEHNELHNVQFFVAIITLTHLLLTAAVKRRIEITSALGEKSRELSRVNSELDQARRQAMAASEAKSEFLANMSHEIRSPLSAMIGYADLITRDDETEEEKTKYGAIISRNGHHLLDILNQILDLSKIEAGQIEIQSEDTSLRDLINDIAELMERRADEKGLGFQVKWLGPVPDLIHIDPLRLRQILINGLGNAIKFTEKGRVEIRIACPRTPDQRFRLHCEIEDTGIGIAEEERTKLFQAFQQANGGISRRYGGTGLGLELSRRLARMMGGDYGLRYSEKGKGSIFVLELDAGSAVRERPREMVKVDGIPLAQLQSSRLNGLNVLLVDDAADNRFLITRFLQLSGAKVDSAENGRKALERMEAENFDIVLMDIEMPEMNGLEATRRLRQQKYAGPVLALTGRAMPEEIEECLEAGFDGHLIKPIDRELLVQSIAHWTKLNQNGFYTHLH